MRVPAPFVAEFIKDPTDCRTKYLCEPPPQENGFFEIPKKLDESVDRSLHLPSVTQQVVIRSLQRDGFEDVDQHYVQLLVDDLPPPNKDYPYFIHGDPALYSDHFTVALAHRLPETKAIQNADGTSHVINRVVIDFILAWVPRSGIPVDLLDIEDKLLQLARMYNVDTVTFDRWNSANSIQRLFAEGILAYDYSFSASQQLEIYRNLKTLVHNDMISLPDELSSAPPWLVER